MEDPEPLAAVPDTSVSPAVTEGSDVAGDLPLDPASAAQPVAGGGPRGGPAGSVSSDRPLDAASAPPSPTAGVEIPDAVLAGTTPGQAPPAGAAVERDGGRRTLVALEDSRAPAAPASAPTTPEGAEGPARSDAGETESNLAGEAEPPPIRETAPRAADHADRALDRGFDATRAASHRPQPVEPAAQPGDRAPSSRHAEATLSADRAADVLRQVRVRLTPGLRQATVHLQPASLGRVAIRIALREGRSTTEVRAERASTLDAIERHLPELRAALEQQGIDVGEFDLGLGDESDAAFGSTAGGANGRELRFNAPVGELELAPQEPHRSRVDDSGVDTYA